MDLEANARRAITLCEKDAVPEDAVNEVGGSGVEDDHVDRDVELLFQVGR